MIEAQEGLNWERWRRIVDGCEGLGFAALRCSDHLQTLMGEEPRDSLSAWPALALAAEWTRRIQLGPMVSPLTFYRPGVLARIARDVDRLSGGRLVLGLGTGWNQSEHDTFEVPFPGFRERFDNLEEGIRLVRKALGEQRLPLLIGGGGERRTLPIAAAEAAEWNLVAPDLATFTAKSALLDEHCRASGREPGQVRRSIMTGLLIGRDQADLAERAGRLGAVVPPLRGMTPAEISEAMGDRWLVGTPAQIVPRLREFAAAGVQLFMLQHYLLDDSQVLRLLAEEVMPAIASA